MIDATGERYVPDQMDGLIENEHLHRYSFALKICKDLIVVDVASGEGYGSHLLSQVSRQVIGVDVDFKSTRHARAKYVGARNNLSFLTASADRLPIADHSVNLVVSFETIEHIQDQRGMIQECKRILKNDGALLISTPNKLFYSTGPSYANAYHINELERDEFCDLLGGYFRNVEMYNQAIICPSMIRPERIIGGSKLEIEAGEANSVFPFDSAQFNATYYLAVCSNGPDPMPLIKQSLLINKKWIDMHSTMIELSRLRNLTEASDFYKPVEMVISSLESVIDSLGFSGGISADLFRGSLEIKGDKDWTGWAVRSDSMTPADIVVVSDGFTALKIRPCLCRPDVSKYLDSLGAWMSGFALPYEYASRLNRKNLRAAACVDGYGVGDIVIF